MYYFHHKFFIYIEWILSNFHHTSPKKMGTFKLRYQNGERLQMAQDVSNA
jgi:hypothetical protein